MAQPPPPPATVERGPSIRLPWFTRKEDEQVEKYFRELKRLKAIYKWQDDHLLNMSLLGLKGRADDWASAIADADKDTFAKLEEAAEVKEESKQNEPVTELVDRFGIARLESMPLQGKKTGAPGGRYNQRGQDKPRQQWQNKNY